MKEILGMWFKGHEKTDRLLRLLASDLRETKLKKWPFTSRLSPQIFVLKWVFFSQV